MTTKPQVRIRPPIVPVLNLPNALTGFRLLLAPVLGVVLVVAGDTQEGRLIALLVFGTACLTDVADGHLARARGLCTDFGAFIDPIADKALVGAGLVALSLLGVVPWWATAVIMGREVMVTLIRLAVLRHAVIPASRGGKAKTVSQSAAIVVCLLPLPDDLAWVGATTLLTAVACTVLTGLDYAVRAARLRSHR